MMESVETFLMRSSRQTFRSPALLLTLIALLGLGLRLIQLDFQPLWWDEGYTVWFAAQPLAEMLARTAADIHPPLYYALLHGWTQVFGLAPLSLRAFSVLLSLPAIPLAYALGRDMRDRPTGYLAALLVAVNPMAIYYGQEVRMYGLAATLSLAALWTGWRWGRVQREGAKSQSGEEDGGRWKWGVAYGVSVLAGLYTLYIFILLPLAQFLWMLWARRRRWKAFVGALAAAGLLYLPWALYAGPKLLSYVPNKVVKDNDTPLPLFAYLARHLSAFTVGHLEGWAGAWWAWALLLLIPPLAALALAWRSRKVSAAGLGYLVAVLAVALTGGFLQQMRAPFIPEHFERVLFFAAPALWLLLALGVRSLWEESQVASGMFLSVLFVAQALSLAAFYTTPRYAGRDYRPLIATVSRNLRPGDNIFVIYPWQAGYFLAYLPEDQAPTLIQPDADWTPARGNSPWLVLSPDPDWTPAVEHTLELMGRFGGVWFPEHLSLGGIFETKVEDYLNKHNYFLRNQWYGSETRLTGWDAPRGAAHITDLVTPQAWENGVRLIEASYPGYNYRIFFDLTWEGDQSIAPEKLIASMWLRGPDGQRWAQQDVTPFAQPAPSLDPDGPAPWRNSDRIAMTLPAGLPPGEYDLMMALLRPDLSPISTDAPNPAPEVWLGSLSIQPPAVPPHPAYSVEAQGEGVGFLGYDRGEGPWLTGDDIPVTLYWRPRGSLSPDRELFLQLLDGRGQMAAGWQGPPIAWLPTSQWTNEPLRTQHKLRVPADLPPGEYRMIAGLFDPASGQRIAWGKADALELGAVAIEARAHDFRPPHPQHPLNLTLQGGHQLAGYDLVAGTEPGAPINLILYWRPAGPTDIRYSVFVHLIDQQGTILAQDDREPADGEHPTTSWLAGETIADAHAFPFPATAKEGPFGLEVGLYDPLTGRRVPFVDASGEIVADHIVIPMNDGK